MPPCRYCCCPSQPFFWNVSIEADFLGFLVAVKEASGMLVGAQEKDAEN